jgi:predicted nuclease of predicted toxin-antitoxin system
MLLLLDQNIPRAVADELRRIFPAWKILHTSQVELDNKSDDYVFQWVQDNQAVIVTYDEDFADRRIFTLNEDCGIVRLRVWPTTAAETVQALNRLFSEVAEAELRGALIIVGRSTIRIRSLRK